MKRREFVTSVLASGLAVPAMASQDHPHEQVDGPLANATVSFGQWQQFDRFAGAGGPNDRTKNNHLLIPFEAKIKAGGAVNFVIAGFHQVLVYAPGTDPADINTS